MFRIMEKRKDNEDGHHKVDIILLPSMSKFELSKFTVILHKLNKHQFFTLRVSFKVLPPNLLTKYLINYIWPQYLLTHKSILF